MQLTIAGAKIRMDKDGRYSMNDLHKAAVAEGHDYKRTQVEHFMRNESTQKLITELRENGELEFDPCVSSTGRYGGTWVSKEVVYAYAMWISAEFMLRVIRAYDALVNGRLEDAARIASRNAARLEAPYLTDAIKHRREIQGKEVAHYHFSNEFDLINRVALGLSAKQYRAEHGLSKDEPIRDHLTPMEIRCIEHLQRANATMIDLGFDFEKRKADLHRLYVTRHAAGLMAEVERILV